MSEQRYLNQQEINDLAVQVAGTIRVDFHGGGIIPVYPIPRGGVPAAYAIAKHHPFIKIVDHPEEAKVFVDDIIDSGATREKYIEKYPGRMFYALVDKTNSFREGRIHKSPWKDQWIIFPWEATGEASVEDNIVRLLQYIGEDPTREGLLETPARVAKAWKHWCRGYNMKPEQVLKTFTDGAKGVDEMVIVRNTPFYSFCEHHMAPFFGTMTIAYVPDKRIVGLSKLARVADVFARRLQVQERLTTQIADALETHLAPLGVGVVIKARHMCVESRGVEKQGSDTITSALRGVIKDKPEARAEFMALASR